MDKWTRADRPYYQRLVAFACAEGIFFCTLFCIIYWFRNKGLFPNFVAANESIAADESLHRDWGVYLFKRECQQILSQYEKGSEDYQRVAKEIRDNVYEIVLSAVDIEDQFVDYILSDALEDLTAKGLKIFARVITDNLLAHLGYSTRYNVRNPYPWASDICMEQKTNFYEGRVMTYAKRSLADVLDWKKRAGLTETSTVSYDNPEAVDF